MAGSLDGRSIIIYGGGGGLGRGVAAAMALEGGQLFLAGRRREPIEAAVAAIVAAGGRAHATVLDATDEEEVSRHADMVMKTAGRIDVSFNLVSRGDVQGTPLVAMSETDFNKPFEVGLTSNFITARAAVHRMKENSRGVVLFLTSASSTASTPLMGSTAAVDAATEAFMLQLAAEVGPDGIRVAGIWTAGVMDALSEELRSKVFTQPGEEGMTGRTLAEHLAGMSVLRRSPTVENVASAAVFLASDLASGTTGTILNVTAGLAVA